MATPRKWPAGIYSYLMLNPDGIPYYAGAGINGRCNPKSKRFDGVCPDEESRKACGKGSLVFTWSWNSYEEAYQHEKELIAKYGRLDQGTGSLYNRTPGGMGRGPGFQLSAEARAKISAAKTGRKLSIEQCRKQSERMRGNTYRSGQKHTEETKQKISKSTRGVSKPFSESHRASVTRSIAASNSRRKGLKLDLSPEQRAARSERMKAFRAAQIKERIENARH